VALAADLAARDRRDSTRPVAPLRPAPDAALLDTTRLTLDEVVEQMEGAVRAHLRD
jgi:cytidylate kinase